MWPLTFVQAPLPPIPVEVQGADTRGVKCQCEQTADLDAAPATPGLGFPVSRTPSNMTSLWGRQASNLGVQMHNATRTTELHTCAEGMLWGFSLTICSPTRTPEGTLSKHRIERALAPRLRGSTSCPCTWCSLTYLYWKTRTRVENLKIPSSAMTAKHVATCSVPDGKLEASHFRSQNTLQLP